MKNENNNQIPRRNIEGLLVPAEVAIQKAMLEVENLWADPRLTDAIMKLEDAKRIVSEVIDERLSK